VVRVGLVGYFGWGNFGDELMLEVWRSALAGIAETGPVHSILKRPYFERPVADIADGLDAVLIGGGDLVLPDTVSSLYWNRAWLRRPVVVSGVGVALERPGREDVRPRMTNFLCHPSVRSIGMRDETSAAWVRGLEPRVPVRSAPDLGFAAPLPTPAAARNAVAVVLRKTPSADDVATVGRIREWARAHELGTELLVLATSRTRDDEVRGLRAAFGSSLDIVTAETTTELSSLVGAYRGILSAKFHGLVVGLRHGLAVASLRQTHKVVALADMLGDRQVFRPWHLDTSEAPPWSAPRTTAEAVRSLEEGAREEVDLVRRVVADTEPARGREGSA